MLAGPGLVDQAGLHRVERVVHADGAEVDVEAGHRHGEDGAPAVDQVRKLHRLAALVPVREVEDEAGHADDRAQSHHEQPEERLLAGVELARGHVLAR